LDFDLFKNKWVVILKFMTDKGSSSFGIRPSRLTTSLTPEQVDKYGNMAKDPSERMGSGRTEEYTVPDPSGMMCLKLFMSVEVDLSKIRLKGSERLLRRRTM
jgi:hypothetical protein